MTVAELIAELQRVDGSLDVYIPDDGFPIAAGKVTVEPLHQSWCGELDFGPGSGQRNVCLICWPSSRE